MPLSSILPPPGHKSYSPVHLDDHAYAGPSKSAILAASLPSGSARPPKSIPHGFLTHHTPFAAAKHSPPSGVPGHVGVEGFDTGEFAADPGGEDVEALTKNQVEIRRKKILRVIKLVGLHHGQSPPNVKKTRGSATSGQCRHTKHWDCPRRASR
jgi:hypothetical protein